MPGSKIYPSFLRRNTFSIEFAEPRQPIRPQVLYPIAQGQGQNQRQVERAGVAASGNRRRARPVSPANEEDANGQVAGRRSGRRAAAANDDDDNQQQEQ